MIPPMQFLKAHRLAGIVIATVFAVAAISKLRAPGDAVNLVHWIGVPPSWSSAFVGGLAGTELLVAMLLVSGVAWARVRWVAIVFLAAFMGVLGFLVFAQDPPHCGCVGRLFNSARTEALFGIGRNLVLIALVLGAWKARENPGLTPGVR
jgi:uncharacterized membrane protein YphA (DoxX/SURF4 family)